MFNIIHHKEVTSTNIYLKNNFKINQAIYTVKPQMSPLNRAQKNIPWLESKGSIAISFALKHTAPELLILILAYSLAKLVKGKIKWPNDVIINKKKLAGILVQPLTNQNIVIGIGINLNNHLLPLPIKAKATSLWLSTKKKTNPHFFIKTLVKNFTHNIDVLTINKIKEELLMTKKPLIINGKKYQIVDLLDNGQVIFTINGQKQIIKNNQLSFTNNYNLINK